MSSGFDPGRARWDRVEVPACLGAHPAVVRATAPATLTEASPDALLADITAGLTGRFPEVLPIEVATDPPGVPRGSVRLLHTAIDPDGEGVAIETLLLRNGTVTCWVAPAARYPAELAAARRAMAGRPSLPPDETVAPDEATAPGGMPVAEARLTVTGHGQGDWLVSRHGPAAHALPASPAEPVTGVELPVSVLPAWMSSVTGTGPRPVPRERPMLITSRSALDRLLGLTDPDDAAIRTTLEAPDLPDAEATGLGALVRGLVRRWSLEWSSGRDDDSQEPTGDGSTTRLESRGRLEILDAGSACGLWRVLTDLPEVLTRELTSDDPGERPVGLARTAPADVWHELTLPIAG